MEPERRQRWLLAALALLLVVAAVYWLRPAPAASPRASSNVRGKGQTAAGSTETIAAPDVHLEALGTKRAEPGGADRDLFRFKPKPPPAPPSSELAAPPSAPGGPAPPPPLPPIALKFIGVIQEPGTGRKIAALSDGRNVWSGAEGATILGQYKILRIGAESIEMSYLDGRGRQSIRLSGS